MLKSVGGGGGSFTAIDQLGYAALFAVSTLMSYSGYFGIRK